MSPSESELRAALREGEGEGLDVDAQIRHALRSRRDRRRTFAAVGGAVVAVLAVGGVVTALQVGRDESPRAAPPAGARTSAPGPAPVAPIPAACPARPPDIPASWASYQAKEPLFPDGVTAMRACVYGTGPLTESALLDRPTAQYWVRPFTALPPPNGQPPCPQAPQPRRTVVMLAVTADVAARPVVATVNFGNCGMTMNGLSTRLAGQLPEELVTSLVNANRVPPSSRPTTSSS